MRSSPDSGGLVLGDAELPELALLAVVGVLGILGQTMITHGLSLGDATVLVPLDYSRIIIPQPWAICCSANCLACGASPEWS